MLFYFELSLKFCGNRLWSKSAFTNAHKVPYSTADSSQTNYNSNASRFCSIESNVEKVLINVRVILKACHIEGMPLIMLLYILHEVDF